MLYAVSNATKSVDKAAMIDARKGRFPMDKPFPGVPPLKPPGELKVTIVTPNVTDGRRPVELPGEQEGGEGR